MQFVLLSEISPIPTHYTTFAEELSLQMGKTFRVETTLPDDLADYATMHSVDLFFIYCSNKSRTIQRWLNRCRELRLPYVFLTDTMLHIRPIRHILIPVSMLEEEVYKAEIGVHIARHTAAETLLLQAKDYGSKAATNVQKIQGLFAKFELPYTVESAKTDSFRIVRETADREKELLQDITLLTASRDYGLDDLLFGPIERYAIAHSNSPVLLVNPRGDLFSLCD